MLLFGAFIADLCFLVGPAIEGYGTCLRIWNGTLTILLFLAGLGLTAVLAVVFIADLASA